MERPIAARPSRPRVALIAHDGVQGRHGRVGHVQSRDARALPRSSLPGTTGTMVARATDCRSTSFCRGRSAATPQVGAMLVDARLDLVVFFWDPLTTQPHDVDVKALLRLAVLYNVPIACNRSSADFLISSPLFLDAEHLVHRRNPATQPLSARVAITVLTGPE